MTNYFTISEFAKLRNININSLRYYERIGVLRPAKVDEKTGYRYYSPEQLPVLDVILLCIDFGMPLKELARYIHDDAFIQNRELFETGRQIAQARIRDLQMELDKIDHTLRYMNVNQQYSETPGVYERVVPERTIVTAPYTGELTDIRRIEIASGQLYRYAQEKRLFPVFPAGLLVRTDAGQVAAKVFFEVVRKDASDDALQTLDAGVFLCHQVDLTPQVRLLDAIEDTFGADETAEIVVSNMLLDKYQLGTRKSELQKPVR